MKGIDISHYQNGLTIKQVKDAGNEFAIIKVTEGTWFVDAAAFDFYREAYEMGFPVGCYCYSHAVNAKQAMAEAAFLMDTINGFPMPCGVFLDIEEPKQLDLSHDDLLNVIRGWCAGIGGRGYIPGVYSSEGTLWAKISPDELPDGVLAWVAKWSEIPPNTPCDLWQNSDSGRIEGYDGPVDTDVARSSRFQTLVETGTADYEYHKRKLASDDHIGEAAEMVPDACPIDSPCDHTEETGVEGAFALLAEYLQTSEFQTAFLNYIEGRKGK